MTHCKRVALLALLFALTTGASPPRDAAAILLDGQGRVRGKATLIQRKNGIVVRLRVAGLTAGVHAAHIHGVGNCTGPDFASAGGHWNPMHRKHGHDNPDGAHMGDMPNMTVAADGTGKFKYLVRGATIAGMQDALLDGDGASVVIHAAADDYRTDPAGNAGARLVCGVIKAE